MMQYKGYIGTVQYDPDARILHGEISGLRDVITFESSTASGIEKAFRESVDDYLAFCRARGEKPEKSYSGQFLVRADAELHRNLSVLADAAGKSLNALVVDYLNQSANQTLSKKTAQPKGHRRKSA